MPLFEAMHCFKLLLHLNFCTSESFTVEIFLDSVLHAFCIFFLLCSQCVYSMYLLFPRRYHQDFSPFLDICPLLLHGSCTDCYKELHLLNSQMFWAFIHWLNPYSHLALEYASASEMWNLSFMCTTLKP